MTHEKKDQEKNYNEINTVRYYDILLNSYNFTSR